MKSIFRARNPNKRGAARSLGERFMRTACHAWTIQTSQTCSRSFECACSAFSSEEPSSRAATSKGTRPFGFIVKNAGVRFSPLGKSTCTDSSETPNSYATERTFRVHQHELRLRLRKTLVTVIEGGLTLRHAPRDQPYVVRTACPLESDFGIFTAWPIPRHANPAIPASTP
jgi:hypothetical protein